MSQAKVDKYKEYKANRKEILAKQKKKKQIDRIFGWVIGIAIIGAIGVAIGITGYNSYEKWAAAQPTYKVESKVINDLYSMAVPSTEAEE